MAIRIHVPRKTGATIALCLLLVSLSTGQERVDPERPESPPPSKHLPDSAATAAVRKQFNLDPNANKRNSASPYEPHPSGLQQLQDRNSFKSPSVHFYWHETADPVTGIKRYQVFEQGQDGSSSTFVGKERLNLLMDSDVLIVNSGDVPHGQIWNEYIANKRDRMAIHEKTSANSNWISIGQATALGSRRLDPGSTRVFNALPHETGIEASQNERALMGGITGSRQAWEAVNLEIAAAAPEFPSQVATKRALLHELQFGNANVIVLYAHFDGNQLYLPGTSGETLSVDEIANIDRTNDPGVRERIIILAACSTAAGRGDNQAQSLVQVLLQKGIARTVFATDRPYDARYIPELMTRLKSQPVREAAGQLQQHVELQLPLMPEAPDLQRSQKGAMIPGE